MKGSLQLKRGIWQVVICYKDESGDFKYKWISTGLPERGNKKVAQKILDKEIEKFSELLESGQIPEPKKQNNPPNSFAEKPKKDVPTFIKYLENNLEQRRPNLSPSVAYNYIERNLPRVEKYFGSDLKITELTADMVQGFYDDLTAQGLKGVSVKHFACVLHPALREAYKDGYLKMNIIDFLKVPKRDKYRGAYYDKADLEKLFNCIKGNELELVFKAAAYYGFRRSELLGLRWDAIDFERKTVQVRHKFIVVGDKLVFSDELKTKSSCRTLPLMPSIETELRKQLESRAENMKFFGDTYCHKYDDYVFVQPNGKMWLPNFVTKSFVSIIRNNKLKKIRFHDLRHSCASLMLAEGVPMKQIQEWLGHASFSTTADIYSHLDYSSKLQSADRIAGALDKVSAPPTVKESDEQDRLCTMLAEMDIPASILLKHLKDMQEKDAAYKAEVERRRIEEQRYSNYNTNYNNGYVQQRKPQKSKYDDYCL